MHHYNFHHCKGSRLEIEEFDHEKRQVTADILKELHYRNVVTLSLHSVQDCVAYLNISKYYMKNNNMLTEYFFACTFLLKQIATSVRRAATHAQLMKCVRTRLDLTLALVFLGTLERQETVKVIHRCNLFLNTPDLFLPFNCCSFTDPSSEMTIKTIKV